jgi:FKBP-type peptidyl-prolyl cis-trans isomerase
LYIPPSLGYGAQDQRDPDTGAVFVPANSLLVFDVFLVDIQ